MILDCRFLIGIGFRGVAGVAVHGSPVEDYCRAPRGGLITRYHGYAITDKSDEGQDASSRIEMGNTE